MMTRMGLLVAAAWIGAAVPAMGADIGQVQSTYNEFRDETLTKIERLELRDNPGHSLILSVFFRSPGKTATPAKTVKVGFISDASAPRYQDSTVQLSVDGTPLASEKPKWIHVEGGREGHMETLTLELPAATFIKLSMAKEVTGRIGNDTFVLTPAQQKNLRTFSEHLETP